MTAARVRSLADLRAPEVGERLSERSVLIQPVGAIEQHGPHLPISTDHVCATEIAAAAVDRVAADDAAPAVLLPSLAYTKSDEHHAFPGSIWLSWDTLMSTFVDIGRSLSASGITRLLFVNGHGGNSALGQVACREIRIRFGLRTFFAHLSVPADQGGRTSAETEYGMGVHGGHGETSLMLHLRPDLVHMERAGREHQVTLTGPLPGNPPASTATSRATPATTSASTTTARRSPAPRGRPARGGTAPTRPPRPTPPSSSWHASPRRSASPARPGPRVPPPAMASAPWASRRASSTTCSSATAQTSRTPSPTVRVTTSNLRVWTVRLPLGAQAVRRPYRDGRACERHSPDA